MLSVNDIQNIREQRKFIPVDFEVSDWESLKPWYKKLQSEPVENLQELESFLEKRSELDGIVDEAFAWSYIRRTCDTSDEKANKRYQEWVSEIIPQVSAINDKLNQKIIGSPAFGQLDPEEYLTYTRQVKREIELFREENIPLETEVQTVSQKHSSLTGAMTIEHQGNELTMQQAGRLLEENDRNLRQSVWEKMADRRAQDQEAIDEIFSKLVELRHQIAQNAGYDTYTGFKFDAMGRFDYTLEDTHTFHEAVEKVVQPVYLRLMEERKEKLGVDHLRPWDLSVDIFGDTPLVPFEKAEELVAKSIAVLQSLKPELGEMIRLMDEVNYLDLESRKGKAPGGYNYPLMETGVPFIFMNAAGTQGDVITMLHESGHAVHSFLTRDISLNDLKNTPSEVAELASMSMELLALDHYDQVYPDEKTRRRAVKTQLERTLSILPWIATVDAFQQWAYDHPNHTSEERRREWVKLYRRFHGDIVDWTGLEDTLETLWMKQGHIFEVPFYYIEYAIAQLGAFAIWKNFRKDPQSGLENYLKALRVGYQRPIPDIYEAAGIKFDFSPSYVQQSMDFALKEYESI